MRLPAQLQVYTYKAKKYPIENFDEEESISSIIERSMELDTNISNEQSMRMEED